MATVKTIKGVDNETWSEFKSLAAKNKMKNGAFLEKLVDDFKNKRSSNWDKILNSGKLLSDKEADELQEFVKELRKEKGFRI